MKHLYLRPLALIAAGLSIPAMAQDKPVQLSSEVQLVRVVTVDGQQSQTLVKPEGVIPGDKLVFTTTYRNSGGEAVSDFTMVNPVPQHMVLADQDLGSADVSVDGGKTFAKLAELRVTDASTAEERPAQSSDVTHLRWTISSVAPGGEGSVKFSALVR
ncbi:MAG: hypothetical protein ACK5NN_10540 [Sphingomonadaceae bacterium]